MKIIKQLSNNSIKLPAIGQGMGAYSWNDSQIDILRAGIELGMNLIDTAELYDNGLSEEIIGRAVKGIRGKVIIATKFSPEHSSYQDVLKAAEGSLRRLNTDYIDLYQIHWPNINIPLKDTISAMEKLVKNGKVRHIGLGNMYLEGIKDAHSMITDNAIASFQTEYNLFNRSIEEDIIPYCEQKKIMIIAYSPLDRGRWQEDDVRKKTLDTIAQKYNRTAAQITLRWLINNSPVVVIPKTSDAKHLRENAAAADFDLIEEDIKKIDDIFKRSYVYVLPDKIREKTCRTLEEAIKNRIGFVPSPVELARTIVKEKAIKPVRLTRSTDRSGKYDYDLLEGRLRYWAWVIAHDGKVPIRAFVQQ